MDPRDEAADVTFPPASGLNSSAFLLRVLCKSSAPVRASVFRAEDTCSGESEMRSRAAIFTADVL